MCWQCVYTTTLLWYKSTQCFLFYPNKSKPTPFSNQAVHRLLAGWRSSAQASPMIVDWQWCQSLVLSQTALTVISLLLFWHWSRCRQECFLINWGVLLLDVIMNMAIVIYSQHLSHWGHSGLCLILKGMWKWKRGEQSRAHWHLKEHATKWLAVTRAVFDRVKTVLL